MLKVTPISLKSAFSKLQFLANRTPETTDEEATDAFATLSEYRDGGSFIGHYVGHSEWERHPNGDEMVMVVEGETTSILLVDNSEVSNKPGEGELLVVPQITWHRFESPKGVKVMTDTPQPTEHSIDLPQFI
jgi:mannose-6-phosphate isomerase-like protein (cupin superfamily)